jgi:YHS domain-containing protein
MAHVTNSLFSLIVVGVVALLAGCNSSSSPTQAPPAAGHGAQEPTHGGHSPAASATHDAQDDPLAALSAEDRAAAEKQGVCPVSGEKLGSMGTPYKVTVKGRTVFLCCDGCEEDLKKDPDKYLAKLNK